MVSISFVLPVKGGSGGAHSVVQEVQGMRQLGIDANILVNERNLNSFKRNYGRFDWIEVACKPFSGPKDLAQLFDNVDIAIATTNTSAHSIAEAVTIRRSPISIGYYVQDYEPLFYPPHSENWNIAISSFNLFPTCKYFAKTRWLRDIVAYTHGHNVELVVPSIDRSVYHPSRRKRTDGKRRVTAMVRTSTARRAPIRTMRVFGRLASKFRETEFVVFGSSAAELEASGIPAYENVTNVGVLTQSEVADLLQQSDFFADLSDYQAFGRTAAEAMSCGAIALAPSIGGASEFIDNGSNSFIVKTHDDAAVVDMIERMISMTDGEIRQMRLAAIQAVAKFTPEAAAISELKVFDLV